MIHTKPTLAKFLAGAAALLIPMAGFAQEAHDHHQHHMHGGGEAMKVQAPGIGEESLYQLGSTWTNQKGEKVALKDLSGKPRLLVMVYTSCQAACPLLVRDMKNVASKLTKSEREKLGYVVASFDPEKDTPEALAKFSEKMKLTGDWAVLTGSASDVSELAAALGVQYKKLESGDFIHSNVIFLLDASGEIKSRLEGIGVNNDTFVKDVKNVIKAAKAEPAKAGAKKTPAAGGAPAKK